MITYHTELKRIGVLDRILIFLLFGYSTELISLTVSVHASSTVQMIFHTAITSVQSVHKKIPCLWLTLTNQPKNPMI